LGVHTIREKPALVNWPVFVVFPTFSASLVIRGLQRISINRVNIAPLRVFSRVSLAHRSA
jgi:hypothetical protein